MSTTNHVAERQITITIGDTLHGELLRYNNLMMQKKLALSPEELDEMDTLRDRIALKLYCSVINNMPAAGDAAHA